MGMCLGLHSVSDENIKKIIAEPELILWLLGSQEQYLEILEQNAAPSFFGKLLGKQAQHREPSQIRFVDGENQEMDLDKAWHGIHFCLNGSAEEGPNDFLLMGGEWAGQIDVGYGPARLFTSQQVANIVSKLESFGPEELESAFDPDTMAQLDIYPSIWDEGKEAFSYLAEYYKNLFGFLLRCKNQQLGVAIYLS